MSKLRGLVKIMSLLALLHLLALVGFVGHLWNKGTINPERVEIIAGVLRGEYDAPPEDESGTPAVKAEDAKSAQDAIALEQTKQDAIRSQIEREQTALAQQHELILRERAQVLREREAYEERRRRDAEADNRKQEQNYRSGFEKQLEYLEAIKPKAAVQYVLSRDVKEAAELLRAMDTRKGKKIIEAAKTPNQRKKMDEILKLLPELNVEQ
ncbi:MAG: hypothetical protein KAV82_04335 [Phycisphaerae bacterium]|nr:hypothetical protein [Phycisphaerae bacterium]